MPTLAVARDFLFRLIGKTYSEKQFEDLCFEFGVELDDVTSEKEMYNREQVGATGGAAKELSEEVIYKIDTPANRYDLLSAEGMSLALKVFLGTMPAPKYRVINQSSPAFKMVVDKSVKNVRDFVVCAVLKNITFTPESYNSFIDFQEKLHSGLARKRTLASVGTHDLDKLNGATVFRYSTTPKESISFTPLNQTKVMNCAEDGLAQYYKEDRHISKFIPLISSLPRYPTIHDVNGNLLSLPPIINSDFSKISQSTRNIFIECTAPDHHKASVLVNQIVCAFSTYCADPFTVEAVEVQYEADGKTVVTPDMSVREMTVDLATVNRRVGIELPTSKDCAALLNKMFLYADALDEKTVRVGIPPCRSDILHQCDLIEDVAIAHGYDNIVMTETPTRSNGYQTPVNKLSQLLRLEIVGAGYVEALTFSLCSRDEAFKSLGRTDNNVAVHVANPQTFEFQICRPSLMPGLLKTFQASKSNPLPLRLFEVSDIVMLDNDVNFPPAIIVDDGVVYNKTGARNERHFAALNCTAESSGFEDIHGLVEYTMMKIGIPQISASTPISSHAEEDAYYVREGRDPAFFPGRAMDIVLRRNGKDTLIGNLGVVHPIALKAFDLPFPCSFCEINIQPFV
jgi:phenylalanyl-tRNA synthetase beta chain